MAAKAEKVSAPSSRGVRPLRRTKEAEKAAQAEFDRVVEAAKANRTKAKGQKHVAPRHEDPVL